MINDYNFVFLGPSNFIMALSVLGASIGPMPQLPEFDEGEDVRLTGYSLRQVEYMEESCLLINDEDHYVGTATKKAAHLRVNIDKGMLHRAFSVFLFNQEGNLLLQKRSDKKITFPMHWTNSCCSHPLLTPQEMAEHEQQGVRLAAQRKLRHELGLPLETISLNSFQYVARIRYSAPFDDIWGENEVDYILFLRQEVNININPEEVSETRYVSQEELKMLVNRSKVDPMIKITPWLLMLTNGGHLWRWWDALLSNELHKSEDDKAIILM